MVNKIIRLTEADLTNLVKRVISEQSEERKYTTAVQKFLNDKRILNAKLDEDGRDADALNLVEGEQVVLRSDIGSMNARVKIVVLPSRSIQVHWPEGNVLIDAGINEDASRIPDYNAVVTIEKLNKG
jgi:hypothetical protein